MFRLYVEKGSSSCILLSENPCSDLVSAFVLDEDDEDEDDGGNNSNDSDRVSQISDNVNFFFIICRNLKTNLVSSINDVTALGGGGVMDFVMTVL